MKKVWSSSTSPLFKGSIDSERKPQVESILSPPGPIPVTKSIENGEGCKDLGTKVLTKVETGTPWTQLGWEGK